MLAAIWAAVLLPSLVRSRIASSPIDGVRNFEQTMGVLGGTRSGRRHVGTSGRWVMVPSDVTAAPRRRARIIQRRRRMFVRLVSLVAVTLPLGAVPSLRWVWFLNLAADAVLGLYVWRLLQWKRDEAAQQQATADAPAHSMLIPAPELRPEPALAFEDADAEEYATPVRPRLVTRTG